MRRIVLCLLLPLMALATGANACSSTTPCVVGDRAYFIVLPEAQSDPMPAIVYIHGWGGSGDGALKNTGMADLSLPLINKIGAIDIEVLEVETDPDLQ